VTGPPGTRTRLAEAMETLFPGSSRAQRRFPVQVTELAPGGTPAELRGHLGELQAESIVLTHMSARMLSRLADAELPAAYDGMAIDL
jgi:hypothetical protein